MPAPRLLARFARDRRAVAAVEFALLLPVMMVMYLGVAEVARAVANSRKVAQLARTLADLTSRGSVTAASMDDIIAAKTPVLAPFDAAGARIVVSSIGVYGSGSSVTAKVCSSKASGSGATALARNAPASVPAGYETAGLRFIRADVAMDYTPILGTNILKWFTNWPSITFSEQVAWPVRSGTKYNSTYDEIVMPSGTACPA